MQLSKFLLLIRTIIVFEEQGKLETRIKISKDDSISIFNNQGILYNKAINSKIQKSNNKLVLNNEYYEPHPIIKNYLPLFILKMKGSRIDTFDDKKIRLETDFTDFVLDQNKPIVLRRTSYFRDNR